MDAEQEMFAVVWHKNVLDADDSEVNVLTNVFGVSVDQVPLYSRMAFYYEEDGAQIYETLDGDVAKEKVEAGNQALNSQQSRFQLRSYQVTP